MHGARGMPYLHAPQGQCQCSEFVIENLIDGEVFAISSCRIHHKMLIRPGLARVVTQSYSDSKSQVLP